MTIEVMISVGHTYTESVSELLVHQKTLQVKDVLPGQVLLTRAKKELKMCDHCGKPDHIIKDC